MLAPPTRSPQRPYIWPTLQIPRTKHLHKWLQKNGLTFLPKTERTRISTPPHRSPLHRRLTTPCYQSHTPKRHLKKRTIQYTYGENVVWTFWVSLKIYKQKNYQGCILRHMQKNEKSNQYTSIHGTVLAKQKHKWQYHIRYPASRNRNVSLNLQWDNIKKTPNS